MGRRQLRSNLADHPFARSGIWAVTAESRASREVASAVLAADPDAWLSPTPEEPAWFETAAGWSPRAAETVEARPSPTATPNVGARMNMRTIGETIGTVMFLVALATLTVAGLHLFGWM